MRMPHSLAPQTLYRCPTSETLTTASCLACYGSPRRCVLCMSALAGHNLAAVAPVLSSLHDTTCSTHSVDFSRRPGLTRRWTWDRAIPLNSTAETLRSMGDPNCQLPKIDSFCISKIEINKIAFDWHTIVLEKTS